VVEVVEVATPLDAVMMGTETSPQQLKQTAKAHGVHRLATRDTHEHSQ